jgi:hypothetical protein
MKSLEERYQQSQQKRICKGIAKIEKHVKAAQHEAAVLGFVQTHDYNLQHELRQALRAARTKLYLWQHTAGLLTNDEVEEKLKEVNNAAA